LREQDEDGLDAEVLFPPVFASRFLEGIKDPDVYRAMIRAYNTWLANDYCAVAPDRLIGNSVTPISDIDHAVAEVEFAHSAGLKSVAFYQFPNGTGYSEPEDDKFWAKCIELGMAISPHFGFGQIRPEPRTAGSGTAGQPYAEALVQRAGSHAPVFCMAQLMAAGVLDRFPDIKFYFAEANASWLPSTMFFMDDNHEIFSSAFGGKRMKMTPSEYVAKHFHFSIIRDPLALEFTDKIPVDNLMWGSDFPHSVGSFPKSQEFIKSAFKGKEKLKQKVLLDNPARYFKLDLTKEITPTPAAA
jgi:predicted TIM-barrel fold metal-dependent hydrolase